MRWALFLFLAPTALSCVRGQPDGITVGSTWIPGSEIDEAVAQMRRGFPERGRGTLAWQILDGGYGPACLLHDALPEASAAARAEAERWAARLRDGTDPAALAAELLRLPTGQDPTGMPRAPNPFELESGRAAAAVAALEPGEWCGPLKTVKGWEILYLADRQDGPRNRAGVSLIRLTSAVGGPADRDRAVEAWSTLPLRGSRERLLDLPYFFRRGRTPDLGSPP